MKIKEFTGDFYQTGHQQGIIYKANGMSFDAVKVDHQLYKKQLQVYQQHYPELLETFKGMAEGGSFSLDKLTYSFITDQLFYYRNQLRLDKACTIFGVKIDNRLYVGRNYDWLPPTEELFQAYKVNNPSRNNFIGVSDMGIASVAMAKPQYLFYDPDDAINDQGLFIGLTFAYADEWSYGLSSTHMIQLIAETCKTVDEALAVFDRVPLCTPKNFFIADKNGNMAIVEHTSKKFEVVRPKNNILIQTNHYVDTSLAKEDTVLEKSPSNSTFIRFEETLQNIQKNLNSFTVDSIVDILGKPESCTCQNSPDMRTIWTLALNMTESQYKIYWDVHNEVKTTELKIV